MLNLDRINEEFYTGQDLRRYRARGAEERLLKETAGEQERATTETRGEQQRLTVGKTGEETRATNLQQEQFRRYKEARDEQQAKSAYRA